MAVLAADWARAVGGSVLALVVDHGLRPSAAEEARATLATLASLGIPGRLLTLALRRGPRQAERARDARHAALEAACRDAGIVHLLFGHHAADQAETVAMRRVRGSGPAGLAGMAALSETAHVRRLRPLLDMPPVRLRRTLLAAGLTWIEDPSNADPTSERVRLRLLARDRDGAGPLIRGAVAAAVARGAARARAEAALADWLGAHVTLYPNGCALVAGEPIPPEALGALIATVGGRPRPPSPRQLAGWIAAPRPATLGGVQILRRGAEWVLAPELAARPGGLAAARAWWDARAVPPVPRGADGAVLAAPAVVAGRVLAPPPFVTCGAGDAEPDGAPYLRAIALR
jgi:tRNA(Ile)-lysidine synthase